MRQPDFSQEQPVARRPHAVAPHLASVRLVMVSHKPRMSASAGGISVMSNGTARTLRYAGVHVDSWEVFNAEDLMNRLDHEDFNARRQITHIVLHTPNWEPAKLQDLAVRWPDIDFVQLNHSGLAYLDLDENGHSVKRIRRFLDLQMSYQNIRVAANNRRVTRMFWDSFGQDALYLPNLYYWEKMTPARARRDFDPLRVGSFGIGRDWKNQPVAAQAALNLSRRLGVHLELHVNIDPWNTYTRVRQGRQHLFGGLPHAKLVEHPWAEWPSFRRLAGSMDILISPSYDETFCCVCADGVVEGVPTVGTDAMEWLPTSWRCREPHDQASVAATGMALLMDRIGAIHDGRRALEDYVRVGVSIWMEYLTR